MLLFINDSATPPAVVASYPDGTTLSLSVHPNATRTMTVPDGTMLVPLPDGAPGYAAPPIDLTAYAASARYTKETAGITVSGIKVATDENSQAKITGAYVKAMRDSTFTTAWKGSDGAFSTLDATTILALGDAVTAYVAACFAAEAQIDKDIASGKVKTTADVDAAFVAVTA